MKICSVTGCGGKVVGKGLCSAHWQRHRKHGDVLADVPITKSRHGSRNSRWTGGEINDGHGRVLIYAPGHPNPSYCGTHVYRYRLVMEKKLGRFLTAEEVVHHKNGNVNDDHIENLVLTTQSEHAKAHRGHVRFQKHAKEIK